MTDVGRRDVVTGGAAAALAAALGLAGRAVAAEDRLFAGTPLAGNRVAATFRRVDLALPDVAVLAQAGQRRLPQLAGKPMLLTLWAEWCAPCLVEARDLAGLRPGIADDRFDIVSVLTGSIGKLDYAGAVERLGRAGALGLSVVVEPDGGHAIALALTVKPPASIPPPALPPGARIVARAGFALPCTLLVDRRGRVRGRASGMIPAVPVTPVPGAVGHAMTEAEKQALMGSGKTAWATPDGLALLRAVRDGALDRV